MFDDVTVIGAGRAGSAIAARLRERGVAVRDDGELRLLCVPDRAIAEVARRDRARARGSRTSRGGTPLAALDPARAPLLGAPAADAHARARARAARRRLGRRHRRDRRGARARRAGSRRRSACGRSRSPTTSRALYHAGAAIASNFLVTLYRAAVAALRGGGRAAGGARAADGRARSRTASS